MLGCEGESVRGRGREGERNGEREGEWNGERVEWREGGMERGTEGGRDRGTEGEMIDGYDHVIKGLVNAYKAIIGKRKLEYTYFLYINRTTALIWRCIAICIPIFTLVLVKR